MLDGPVKDWLPIGTPSNKPKDTPPPPQKPVDIFFQNVATNLKNVSYDNLASGVPSRVKDIPAAEAKHALEFIMLQEAKSIHEASIQPASLFEASTRNRDLVASGNAPIQTGDRLHGMPINFFANAANGILAPEFYGGKTESYTSIYCSVYVSQVTNVPEKSTPEQIISGTHTGSFGLQEGTVTVIFDKDSPSNNIHEGTVGSIKPNSIARVISVGERLPSVKGCVAANESDIPKTIAILESFAMYMPLYDGAGKLRFSHDDWLKAQKVS